MEKRSWSRSWRFFPLQPDHILQPDFPTKTSHTRTALTVLGICLILNLIGRGTADSYVVFLLPLERDLGWTRSQLTGVYSVYLLVNGLTAPLIGFLFDRIGPRLVYSFGMAVLAVSYLLASKVETMWQFYATIGAGTGLAVAALGMVPSSSMIARWFRERLSTAISVAFAGLGLGALLIVPGAQALIASNGWRDAYRIIGLILLCLVPLVLMLPWRDFLAGHPDYRDGRGAVTAAGEEWTVARALRSKNFWGLTWVFFFTSVGMFSVTVQIVVYLVEQGFPALLAATAFGAASMLSVFGIVTTGAVADRFGPRRTVTATYVGSITGILLLLVMTWLPLQSLLVGYVVAFGLCQGARGPIISSMTTRLFAGRHVASIYGIMYAANAIGAGIGSFGGGLLHDFTGSYRPGFVLAVLILVVAGLPFWLLPGMRDFHSRRAPA